MMDWDCFIDRYRTTETAITGWNPDVKSDEERSNTLYRVVKRYLLGTNHWKSESKKLEQTCRHSGHLNVKPIRR